MMRAMMVAGLMFLFGKADAAQDVREVAFSSATTAQVSVSTSVKTTMDSTQLAGRWVLEIQNQDASANIFCGFASSEISTSQGRRISPGSSWTIQIADVMRRPEGTSAFNVICISAGSSASTAQVTQLR